MSRSPDVSICQAWMAAELAVEGDRHDARCPTLRDPETTCACGRSKSVYAAIETAVNRATEGASRRVLGRYYYRLPETIRPLLGRPDQTGLKLLLGQFVKYERNEAEALLAATREGRRVNPETGWVQGDAGLTERETLAYWLRVRGRTTLDIQRELTPTEHRYDRARWIAVQTVYNLCSQARAKVLAAFGLKAGLEDDWGAQDEA